MNDVIAETDHSIIYRGTGGEKGKPVVIKYIKAARPSLSEIARFKNEYSLIKNLKIDGVVDSYEFIELPNEYALVLEDFGGIPLKRVIEKGKMELSSFLEGAIALSKILGNIHKHKIIHKDIKPHNILINPQTFILKITDFGIASLLNHKKDQLYNPEIIEGTLPYMSPEQTGRMNRVVDYRTDLYSLGVTFYEMATGTLPFMSEDPMEIIHSHIAKKPVSPFRINGTITESVSDIIMKLLEKMPENRYQNSFGVMHDLIKCHEYLHSGKEIPVFPLGRNDVSLKFNIPQKLFGRQNEINTLNRLFEKVKEGSRELILVSGEPGTGKSTLVHEVHRPIVSANGYFIYGKFDQYRRDVPYSAIIQSFQLMIRQMLAEGGERINYWKKSILDGLGGNASIIADVIPDISFIIGMSPVSLTLAPEEAQNRFNHVFKQFLKSLASHDHPLVLFLDDLQWADRASLDLIARIITDNEIRHFMLIGAYRGNEIGENVFFTHALDEISKTSTSVNSIRLTPLGEDVVNEYVSFLLKIEKNEAVELSSIVYKKTNGNPFFINQFMKALYESENLKPSFDIEKGTCGGWVWDYNGIDSMNVTENVIDLMTDKIGVLPDTTKGMLTICSCIGNRFDLETLSIVSDQSITDVLACLTPAIDAGLVYFYNDMCHFLHDRIQEACYSLLSEDQKEEMHYRTGMHILQHTDETKLNDNIFYIINQLNLGKSKLQSPEERLLAVELNYKAGEKAKKSSAYQSAYAYFLQGIDLLENDRWDLHYQLTVSLYSRAGEAAYLNKEYGQMDALLSEMSNNAKTIHDEIFACEVRIHAAISQNRMLEAIGISLSALRKLGVALPESPGKLRTAFGLIKILISTVLRRPDRNPEMKMITDPGFSSVMRILGIAGYPVYYSKPQLMPFLVFESTRISMKHGIAPVSSFTYAGYGIILCGVVGAIDYGYRIGAYAMALADLPFTVEFKARTWFVFNLFIKHWKTHAKETLAPFRETFKIALETGDLEYAAHAINNYCMVAFFTGLPLDELDRETEASIETIARLKQDTIEKSNRMIRQVILNLARYNDNPSHLKGESFNEDESIPHLVRSNDLNSLAYIYIQKTMLCFIFKDFRNAIKNADTARLYLESAVGTFGFAVFHLYDSLSLLAVFGDYGIRDRIRIMRRVKRNQRKMKKWAGHAPENYLHKYKLVEAEICRVRGATRDAIDFYTQAAGEAKANGFIQEEALAYELASRLFSETGDEFIADSYLVEAHRLYGIWGALTKIKFLEKENPFLEEYFAVHGMHYKIDTLGLKNIDTNTIIKASQALSSEIDLPSLLKKLMELSFENAGGQKGCLMLTDDNDGLLYVQAEAAVGEVTVVMQNIPFEKYDSIPYSIVNFTKITGETLVLDDAYGDRRFSRDEYVLKNKLKSVLCVPINIQGKTNGIMYLENNLIRGAFTASRLTIIRFLSAQAAISIENAKLVLLQKEKAALDREIEMARVIQQSLLPESLPSVDSAAIAYKYIPMMAVGGDFVTVRYFREKNILDAFICDVSGHGVSAAITASMISHSLDFFWKSCHQDPAMTICEIGKSLKGKMGGNFFTAIMYSLDLDRGVMKIAGAGHPHPVIIDKNNSVRAIVLKGRLVTDILEFNSENSIVTLDEGDTVLLYTDGISEITGKDGTMLGGDESFFREWISDRADESSNPEELCDSIYAKLLLYSGDCEIIDDITVLAVQYKG